MSFSSELREELARLNAPGRQAGETELAVLLGNLCRITEIPDGGLRLSFSTGNSSAVKKCFTLIQKNVNIGAGFYLPPGTGQTLDLPAGSVEKLRRHGILGETGMCREWDGTVPPALIQGKRNRAYLRGMFLCTGFMSDPRKRYHLEFRCFSQPQADQLREVLAEVPVRAGMTRRKSYFVVYVKDSEDIVMALHLMGASVSLMATENARIYKEMRNNVNRRVNCETANIGKTVESAVRQQEDIRLLRERGILQSLPAQLQEAAALREKHSGASLKELGELADPPVGRSGMNHRLRKLSSLADKARRETAE